MPRAQVLFDFPMPEVVAELFRPHCELLPWQTLTDSSGPLPDIDAILSVAHTRIGKKVARRAAGFDMRVLYHNRNRDLATESELGVNYASLDELLAQSDFVCLNVPLTAQTDKLIGEAQLRAMKPGAFLINTARGAVVDTDALLRALSEGWIAGAGLDVTEPEPLPRDHPLLQRFTPLVSTATAGELIRVLAYPTFRLRDEEREDLLSDYLPFCEIVQVPDPPPPTPPCRDPCDVPFLELTLAGKAEFLVSGDRDLLSLAGQFPCPIVNAAGFLQHLESE